MSKDKDSFEPNPVVAAVLAWIMPGAGHLYLRRRARGLVVLVTITLLFWGGVALGGAMTVSSQAEPWWFAADMLTGVHGLAGWQHQQRVYARVYQETMQKAAKEGRWPESPYARADLVEKELARQKLALVPPVDTAARAFSGVAGLLNLLCIFDALMLALMGRAGEPPRAGPDAKTRREGRGDAEREDAEKEKKNARVRPAEFSREPKASAEALEKPADACRGGEGKG